MKKWSLLISILAAFAVVLFCGTVATNYASADDPHTHCECGGTCNGVGKHVCSNTTQVWTPWSSNILPKTSGYYYLTTNLTHWQSCPDANAEIHICLNGYTFTGKNDDFIIRMGNSGVYTFCDCKETGKIIGVATHSVSGGMFNITAANTTFRLYHLTVDATGLNITNYGGILNNGTATSVFEAYDTVFDGGKAGTSTAVNCGQLYNNGTMYLAGCTLKGGAATNYAGCIFADGSSLTTILDCTIQDGTATAGGGNIYARNNATVVLDHTTVKGGNSALGGNLLVQNNAKVTIQNNSEISGGTVTGSGANIQIIGSGSVAITSGSQVIGGSAKNASIFISGGTLNINQATVKDAIGSSTAGNLGITGGTVTITKSTISGGTSGYCGGNIAIYGTSTTTISESTITGGTANGNGWGGNIGMDATNAVLTLKDGCVLTNGTGSFGGNIMINNGKTVDLNNTTISGGTATKHGGNIYLGGACAMSFAGTMTAGTATNNQNTKNLSVVGATATFTMTGGSITGGGIRLFSGATPQFIMQGGQVTGPTGSCIREETGTVTVSGSAKVDEIYLASGKTMGVGAMNSDALVGIKMADGYGTFAVGVSGDVSKNFFATGAKVYFDSSEGTLSLVAHTPHCVCGGIGTIGNHTSCTAPTWTAWTSATSLPTAAGYYYLTCDVANARCASPAASTDVYLCLNGHTVTGSTDDRIIRAQAGANVHYSVCNCESAGGFVGKQTFSRQAGMFWVDADANNSISLYNCKVDNTLGSTGNYGGIATNDKGTFAAYNCEFIGGTTGGNGGIIASQNKTYLYGCTLKNGKSTGQNGGLISMHGGTLVIDHCTLMNGVVETKGKYGGNLWINNGTTTITDSVIIGGTSNGTVGASIFAGNGTTTITNTVVEGDIYAGTNSKLKLNSGYFAGKLTYESVTAAFIAGGKYVNKPQAAKFVGDLIAKTLSPAETKTIGTKDYQMNYEVVAGYTISATAKAETGDLTGIATVSGGAAYEKDVAVQLSANEAPNYTFLGWYEGDTLASTDMTFNTTATKNADYVAVYRYTGGEGFTVKSVADDPTAVAYRVGEGAENSGMMNLPVQAGTSVTLLYKGNATDFYGWANETGKVVSKSTEFTAIVGSDATYKVITVKKTGKTVVLLSAYGQVLNTLTWTSGMTLPEAPKYFGKTSTGWTMTETEINDSSEAYLVLTATYTMNSDEYTITVKKATVTNNTTFAGLTVLDGADTSITKKIGAFAEIEADATLTSDKTYYFVGFLNEDKKLIGTTTTLKIRKADGGSRTITAVYAETAPAAAPCVVMDLAALNGENAYFEVVRTLPEGCTLIEQGLLFTSSFAEGIATDDQAADKLYIGSMVARKVVSSGTSLAGVTSLNLKNIGTAIIYAKGYVVFKKDGKVGVIYTNTAKCSAEGGVILSK